MKKSYILFLILAILIFMGTACSAGNRAGNPEAKFYDKDGELAVELGHSRLPFILISDDDPYIYTKRGIQKGDTIDQVKEAYGDVWGRMIYEQKSVSPDGVESIDYNFNFDEGILAISFDTQGLVDYVFVYDIPYFKASLFKYAVYGWHAKQQGNPRPGDDKYDGFFSSLSQEEMAVMDKLADKVGGDAYEGTEAFDTELFAYSIESFSWLTGEEQKIAARLCDKYLQSISVKL